MLSQEGYPAKPRSVILYMTDAAPLPALTPLCFTQNDPPDVSIVIVVMHSCGLMKGEDTGLGCLFLSVRCHATSIEDGYKGRRPTCVLHHSLASTRKEKASFAVVFVFLHWFSVHSLPHTRLT